MSLNQAARSITDTNESRITIAVKELSNGNFMATIEGTVMLGLTPSS